jgi:hypothetical protein
MYTKGSYIAIWVINALISQTSTLVIAVMISIYTRMSVTNGLYFILNMFSFNLKKVHY